LLIAQFGYSASNQTIAPVPDGETPSETEQHSPGFNRKDTVHNAESTGYFCWQLATYPLRELVNKTAESVPYGVSEFDRHGIRKEFSRSLPIQVPMVADSPVKFECKYHSTIRLPGNPPMGTVDIVIGQVVAIHIDDSVINKDGQLDPHLTQPIARMGYYDYTVVRETFPMIIPNQTSTHLGGLEGSVKKNKALLENPELSRKEEGIKAVAEQK